MNTHDTKQVVLANDVITLKADKTYRRSSEAVNDLLVELGNYGKTIPFIAVYPAGEKDPITLDGLITKEQLLGALDRAGPSRALAKGAE